MSRSYIDKNKQTNTYNHNSEVNKKKIDPVAQLKWLNNHKVDYGWGVFGDNETPVQMLDEEGNSNIKNDLINWDINDTEFNNKVVDNGDQSGWSEKKKKKKFDRTVKKHTKNINRLISIIKKGAKSTDNLLKNSCEAILRGVLKVFALTRTGDAYKRVKIQNDAHKKKYAEFNEELRSEGKDELEVNLETRTPFFPVPGASESGDIYSPPVYYNYKNLKDNSNIKFNRSEADGFAYKGCLAVVEPTTKEDYVINEIIIHEVQHVFDKHGKSQIETYKSEYRAYYYANKSMFKDFDDKSTTGFPRLRISWKHEKQFRIFDHIMKNYEHIKKEWDNSDPVKKTKFRNEVIVYADPDTEGMNKYNSIRINYFYEALNNISRKGFLNSSDKNSLIGSGNKGLNFNNKNTTSTFNITEGSLGCPKVKNLIDTAFLNGFTKLNKNDANYILDEGQSLRKEIILHLLPDAQMQILKMLHNVK